MDISSMTNGSDYVKGFDYVTVDLLFVFVVQGGGEARARG